MIRAGAKLNQESGHTSSWEPLFGQRWRVWVRFNLSTVLVAKTSTRRRSRSLTLTTVGEMTALFPIRGPIIDFPGRYIDESVGFAVGWMAWYEGASRLRILLTVSGWHSRFSSASSLVQSQNCSNSDSQKNTFRHSITLTKHWNGVLVFRLIQMFGLLVSLYKPAIRSEGLK